jgi:MinD-like ATPase involved in chromosome partitioning or flagellar assembly
VPHPSRPQPDRAPLNREELYPGAVIDGRPADGRVSRLRYWAAQRFASRGELEEAGLERRLAGQPSVSRANTAAVISPKGGVGKTTITFLVGNLIADRLRMRTIAVDANPDFGTLAALAPSGLRCERSLADLLADMERIQTAADLRPYVSALPSGLHLLGAPRDPGVMAQLGPESYGELLALLSMFYELILLDLGTGVAGPLAMFALERADQVMLVTTPDWITSAVVVGALDHVEHERTTAVANKFFARRSADATILEQRLRERRLHRSVAIPYDAQLAAMLDTGTYQLEALSRPTRRAIKRLGVAAAEQLV